MPQIDGFQLAAMIREHPRFQKLAMIFVSGVQIADTDHLRAFDRFKLLMIEQPLWGDDFYFHARLQKQLQTALCLDEAIHSARDAEAALELGACSIVNIKVGRVGGFSEAIAVHDVARRFGIPVWCGGMLESGVGRSHNVALSLHLGEWSETGTQPRPFGAWEGCPATLNERAAPGIW